MVWVGVRVRVRVVVKVSVVVVVRVGVRCVGFGGRAGVRGRGGGGVGAGDEVRVGGGSCDGSCLLIGRLGPLRWRWQQVWVGRCSWVARVVCLGERGVASGEVSCDLGRGRPAAPAWRAWGGRTAWLRSQESCRREESEEEASVGPQGWELGVWARDASARPVVGELGGAEG